jgi:hypothetical protein
VVYTIGPSFVRAGQIWVGTDDGLIQLTRDEGKNWENVTPPALTAWSKVTHLEASHADAGTAYAAVDRHRLDDYQAYLYRTRDFGKTWQRISNGIPEGSFLNCVREGPMRKGLLYACTERGVYVSFNYGDDWQPLQLNLPMTSVRDLVVHENDLVAATFGRGFWILDDITPLRQLGSRAAASDVWLFRPATAFRMRAASDQGTPVPMDESLFPNPPEGAVIDYFLKEKPVSPVQLEILDSEEKVVRRLASDDLLAKANPNDVPVEMIWIKDPKPLVAEAGMHRFVWDLHYAMPKGMRRSFFGPKGPMAVPGEYTVKLTANGKSTSQPLTIKLDPRVKTPVEVLTRQFKLASKLVARLGEVTTATEQARVLLNELEARKTEAANNSETLAALQEFQTKIESQMKNDREGEFGLFGLALPSGEHESLSQAAGALMGLLVAVDSSDVGATADASAASLKWDEAGQAALTRWSALQKEDLERVNVQLEKAKLNPLKVE